MPTIIAGARGPVSAVLTAAGPLLVVAWLIGSTNEALSSNLNENLGAASGPLFATLMAVAAQWMLAFIPGRTGPLEVIVWVLAALETLAIGSLTVAVFVGLPTGV